MKHSTPGPALMLDADDRCLFSTALSRRARPNLLDFIDAFLGLHRRSFPPRNTINDANFAARYMSIAYHHHSPSLTLVESGKLRVMRSLYKF